MIAGLTYNFLPFMILPIYANLERLDVRLIEAAQDLYASSRAAFWRVTLPLSAPGIVAGMLLTFIPAVGDYVNAYFLGGPNQAMIGNVIQGQYLQLANYPIAAALSFVLMALIMVAVVIYLWRRRRRGADGRRRRGSQREWRARRLGAGRVRARGASGWVREHALGAYAAVADRLHADPDRGHRPVLVQRPERELQHLLAGVHARPLAGPVRRPGADRRAAHEPEARGAVDRDRDRDRDRCWRWRSSATGSAAGGRRTSSCLMPMATPEVVIGAALLSMFVYLDCRRGFTTLLIAHVMFSISFVVVVVRSRLIGFDPALEEAAADLGAGPLARFRTVTLPLLAPGVVAAAALAFALSIDDFVVSNFNSGTTVTFPLYIFGASQRGIPVRGERALHDAVRGRRGRARARALAAAPGRAAQPPGAGRRSGAGCGLNGRGLDHPGGGELAELAGVEVEALTEDGRRVGAQPLRGWQRGGVELGERGARETNAVELVEQPKLRDLRVRDRGRGRAHRRDQYPELLQPRGDLRDRLQRDRRGDRAVDQLAVRDPGLVGRRARVAAQVDQRQRLAQALPHEVVDRPDDDETVSGLNAA